MLNNKDINQQPLHNKMTKSEQPLANEI